MIQCIIAGKGLVTPLGLGVEATWRALIEGQYITDHGHAPLETAEGVPRAMALARRAADEAIAEAGWDAGADEGMVVVVGTSKGPITQWLGCGVMAPTGLGEIAAHLASVYNARGGVMTISAACASSLHALIRGTLLIQSGETRRALVVGVEASLHPLFFGSFDRLGILSKSGLGCRPFDVLRDGFLMSESAGAICLERRFDDREAADPSSSRMSARGAGHAKTVNVAIDGFALGSDAFHITGVDPTGETLRRLLHGLTHDTAIDLVHAHGTGTVLNDAMELGALDATFDSAASPPIVYSHKGALGHGVGAAGLVAAVLNCQAHRYGMIPPNAQTRLPIPTALHLPRQATVRPVRQSLAIAAGFGGSIGIVRLMTL